MFSRLIAVSATAALALVAPAALRAQTPTPSRASLGGLGSAAGRFTLAGAFGGLSGAANLNPAGTTDWRLGWIGSLHGTVWLQSHVGIRAGGGWAQDSIRNAAVTGRGKFNKIYYDADLVLRYPLAARARPLNPSQLGVVGWNIVQHLR